MAIPSVMQAMVLDRPGLPLKPAELPVPSPGPNQMLIKVAACGVCRTDLHILDGELAHPKLPLVLGHEIVGHVVALGTGRRGLRHRRRASACRGWARPTAPVSIAASGQENLCDNPRFTGYQIDGGYADYTVADARYCLQAAGGL